MLCLGPSLHTAVTAEQQLLRAHGFVYEYGEKAGRVLAHQLKCKSASQMNPQIHNTSGVLTVSPTEINNTCKKLYSDLYMSESPEDNSIMKDFLDNLESPTISTEKTEEIDQPLQLEEIIN